MGVTWPESGFAGKTVGVPVYDNLNQNQQHVLAAMKANCIPGYKAQSAVEGNYFSPL